MERLKNNKGITGIDIVTSITLIVVTLAIVITVYTTNSNKTKEVKRTTQATNYAMTVIEYIEGTSVNIATGTTEKSITSGYGLSGTVPDNYKIFITRTDPDDDVMKNIAYQVDVTVKFNIGNEEKKIILSTTKKIEDVGEIEKPSIVTKIENNGEIIYTINSSTNVIPIKYDLTKEGYVKTHPKDTDWYSISSKKFPLVVVASDDDFDRNGVIDLNEKTVYIWEPKYTTVSGKIRFVQAGKLITYDKKIIDSSISLHTYKLGSETGSSSGGKWVEVEEENLQDPNKQLSILMNSVFEW